MLIYDLIKADKHNAEADRINIKALNRYGDAERKRMEQEQKTLQSMQKLVNRKKGILTTSMQEFVELYKVIIKVELLEIDGTRETEFSKLSPEVISEMQNMITVSGYSLSNGQTMSTFTMGFLVGGLAGGITKIISKEAELNEAAARVRKKASEVAASQQETITSALDAIYQRTERMANLMIKMNILFRKNMSVVKEALERNGSNKKLYTKKEIQNVHICLEFALAIKVILDEPILDMEGELMQHSITAIMVGEEKLSRLEAAINE